MWILHFLIVICVSFVFLNRDLYGFYMCALLFVWVLYVLNLICMGLYVLIVICMGLYFLIIICMGFIYLNCYLYGFCIS